MNQRNENNKKHGYWEFYHRNGNLWRKGSNINGLRHGPWESYWANGKLWYKGNYINGNRIGFWIYENKTEFYFYL
jgi:antitoxin component YwqK of YwqJK toxin-antitoxin module